MDERLRQLLTQAIAKLYPGTSVPDFSLSHPDNEAFGEYATNLAMVLARDLKIDPYTLAEQLIHHLPSDELIESYQAVRPGFINIQLRPQYYWQEVTTILETKNDYGRKISKEIAHRQSADPSATPFQEVLFEFGQPNTHKIPHIGHLYSYCYGESCVRLLTAVGNQVHRANYQGDIGLHVAKCLWGYRNSGLDQQQQEKAKPLDSFSLEERVQLLQTSYQAGAIAYEENPESKTEIDLLNRDLYSQEDQELMELWHTTRQWSLDYYKSFEQRIGASFDRYYLESELIDEAVSIITSHTPQIFTEDEGAYIFKGEPYGLHTRVFLNRFGNPTYEAKDVALAKKKAEEFSFDRSVVTTGNEQNEYWAVVKQAIELVWPEYAGKIKQIGYGMVNLTTGKMSSRTGQIVTAVSLIEMVKDRVREYIQANRDYPADEIEFIAERVAIGAIKYSFLRSSAGKNIAFDLESSVAFDGNSGPYLQYTYARCQSVWQKASTTARDRLNSSNKLPAAKLEPAEQSLLRFFARYPEVVNQAAISYAPHVLCQYLFELAQRFSIFYSNHQIVSDDPAVTDQRLQLTAATAQILKNGLELLGIEVSSRI